MCPIEHSPVRRHEHADIINFPSLYEDTDALVRSYLQNGNLQYYSIHPPTFLHQYEAWWTTRQHGEDVSLAFTSLLLQMCANAAQGCGDELARGLQYELCETAEHASVRFCEAAEALAKTMAAGTGGLDRVMQLLLAAAWRKSEGLIVEGWHSLSIAVREAQECGKPSTTQIAPTSGHRDADVRQVSAPKQA